MRAEFSKANICSISGRKRLQIDTEAHTFPYTKRYAVSLPDSIAAVTRI